MIQESGLSCVYWFIVFKSRGSQRYSFRDNEQWAAVEQSKKK